MLFSSLQNDVDEYETITIRIGQNVKFWNSYGMIDSGKVVAADLVNCTVDVICGFIIQYKEEVHIDDLIEG